MLGKVVCRRLCVAVLAAGALPASAASASAAPAAARGWTVQPMQALGRPPDPPYDPGETGFMDAVSCTSADFCAAAGGAESTGPPSSAAEFWNGSAWSLSLVAQDSAADISPLLGISCPVAGTCVAVGYSTHTAAPQLPFGEFLTPTTGGDLWPSLAGDGNEWEADSLNAVSCTSPTLCTAVGNTSVSSHSPLLVERWQDNAWQLPAPVTPPGAVWGASTTARRSPGSPA